MLVVVVSDVVSVVVFVVVFVFAVVIVFVIVSLVLVPNIRLDAESYVRMMGVSVN